MQFYKNLHIHIRVLIMNKSIKSIIVLALVPLNVAMSTDGEKDESSSGKRSLSNTMIKLPMRTGPAGDIFNRIPLNPFYMLCCPSRNAHLFARTLLANGFDQYAKVQTYEDAQPKFLDDIKKTFSLLGGIISSIGLAVAAITIFIEIGRASCRERV
jgi:hypothetical protein